jgi:glycosyltransferase involved in cell wall biosynthesis
MKILQINKFYHAKGRSGGVGRYLFALNELLGKAGHEIQIFAMKDKDNTPSIYSSYFVEEQDFSKPKLSLGSIKNFPKFIYSLEAKRKIEQLVKKEKPDIVHIHNIYHHITPSILSVFKKYKIPVVQTLHDFHLISPNYNLCFNNQVHESCSHGKFWRAIIHKCVKNSRSASFAAATRLYFEKISKIYPKNINYFLAPSKFIKDKYIDNSFPKDKMIYLKLFIDIDQYSPRLSPGNYILFFGRIHPQKGIADLIEAVSELPDINLKIVGSGPDQEKLKCLIKEKGWSNIEMVGPKYGNDLKEIIGNSAFVVVPSVWHENSPFSVIESFAMGKPVIASNLGGLPELVEDGKTGVLFKAGDTKDLREKIKHLCAHPCNIRTMGLTARLFVEKNFSSQIHYKNLMDIYQKAIDQKNV